MSKRTSKPAAAETPAAGATQSPSAGAASAAPEAGVAPTPPADSGASGGIQSPPPGEGVTDPTPSTSSNDTPAVLDNRPAEEPASAGMSWWETDFEIIADAVARTRKASTRALVQLVDHVMAGPSGSAARALAILEAARAGEDAAPATLIAGLEVRAREDVGLEAGDLEELEVRSRDGKPFRRAGFQFGDTYQLVKATADQAAAIRADRRGCQIKGEN